MKTYPQQFEPWRPDYPQVWNILIPASNGCTSIADVKRPSSSILINDNLKALVVAR